MKELTDLVFFDERNFPDLKELIKLEERLGNKGLILAKKFGSEREIKELKEKIEKTFKENEIEEFDLKLAHLISKADVAELRKWKGKVDFISLIGGNVTVNKFAVSTKGVSFLLNPFREGNLSVDTAISRIASENNVPIALTFAQFLNAESFCRMNLFKNYSFIIKLIEKFKVQVKIFSGATQMNELRSLKDLNAFLVFLGYPKEKIK